MMQHTPPTPKPKPQKKSDQKNTQSPPIPQKLSKTLKNPKFLS